MKLGQNSRVRTASSQPARQAEPGTDPPPQPSQPRGTAVWLGTATGFFGITVAAFATTTTLFLANAIHVGPTLIGAYFSVCAVVSIGVNLAAGWLSDRLADRRVALGITAVAGFAGAVIFMIARNYVVILVTGAVLLSLNGSYFSQLFAYAKEWAEAAGREVAPISSAVRSVFSAAWVVGPPGAFYVLTHLGFSPLYAGLAVLLLVTAVLGRWCLPVLPSLSAPPGGDAEKSRQLGLRSILAAVPSRTWLLLGSVTALNVASQMYLISIALYVTQDLHRSPDLVGVMAGFCAALEIPLMIVVGRLADRIGKLRLLGVAVVIAVIFFGLMPMASSPWMLIALQVPNAVWTAVVMTIPMVMAQEEISSGSGTASSVYTSTFTLAQLLAGGLTAMVATQVGWGNIFWICAGLCVLAIVLLLGRSVSRPLDSRTDTPAVREPQGAWLRS